jgi:hypothetical protein
MSTSGADGDSGPHNEMTDTRTSPSVRYAHVPVASVVTATQVSPLSAPSALRHRPWVTPCEVVDLDRHDGVAITQRSCRAAVLDLPALRRGGTHRDAVRGRDRQDLVE